MRAHRSAITTAAFFASAVILLANFLPTSNAFQLTAAPNSSHRARAACWLPRGRGGIPFSLYSPLFSFPEEELPPKPSEGEIDWDSDWKKVVSGEIKVRKVDEDEPHFLYLCFPFISYC